MAKKIKEFKRCPRCDTKALIYQDKCNACGLIYSRLVNASNKEAKKAIRKGEKNKVICDKTLPKDLSKWKLFCMSLFLGFFGGHFYYVGKYKTGVAFTVSAVLLMIAAAFEYSVWQYYAFWMWLMIIPASGCFIYMVVNWFQILGNTFRVPIALKEEIAANSEDENIDKEAVLKIVEEVNTKIKSDQKKAQKQAEKVEKQAQNQEEGKGVKAKINSKEQSQESSQAQDKQEPNQQNSEITKTRKNSSKTKNTTTKKADKQ